MKRARTGQTDQLPAQKGFLADEHGDLVTFIEDQKPFTIPWCSTVKILPCIKDSGSKLTLSIMCDDSTKAERIYAIHDTLLHELAQRKLDVEALTKDKTDLENRLIEGGEDELAAEATRLLFLIRQHRTRIKEIEQQNPVELTYENRHSTRSVELSAGIMTAIPPKFFRPDAPDSFPLHGVFRFSWNYLSDTEADIQQEARSQIVTETIDKATSASSLVEGGEALLSQGHTKKALSYFELAIKYDNPKAMGWTAWLMLTYFVKLDHVLAYDLAQRGAAQSDPRSMSALGRCFQQGTGVARDPAHCADLMSKSATLGCHDGQFWLGGALLEVDADSEKGMDLLRPAEHTDNPGGLNMLALRLFCSDPCDDYEKCFNLWLRAAALGSIDAFYNAACNCYRDGKGVKQNSVRAAYLFQQVADEGDTDAMIAFADIVGDTDLPGADRALAARYYQRAVDEGSKEGMERLAECYRTGKGVRKNLKRAEQLLADSKA